MLLVVGVAPPAHLGERDVPGGALPAVHFFSRGRVEARLRDRPQRPVGKAEDTLRGPVRRGWVERRCTHQLH